MVGVVGEELIDQNVNNCVVGKKEIDYCWVDVYFVGQKQVQGWGLQCFGNVCQKGDD